MAEYKKYILGEATKGLTAGVIGAFILFTGQKWLTNDVEFRQTSRDAYLSAPLGQQGLAMAFDGKPLKNVSVVEFTIVNRTSKQLSNADLLFLVDDPDNAAKLVSGGIIPPRGNSQAETVEELSSIDPRARKFRIKVLPKQQGSEYFHGVFVFDGEKAPSMTVTSASGEMSIAPYQQWRDTLVAALVVIGILLVFYGTMFAFASLAEYFTEPRKHKKQVERFAEHASELRSKGVLQSKDPSAVIDAAEIYASFARPKPSTFWSKILPAQRYEY